MCVSASHDTRRRQVSPRQPALGAVGKLPPAVAWQVGGSEEHGRCLEPESRRSPTLRRKSRQLQRRLAWASPEEATGFIRQPHRDAGTSPMLVPTLKATASSQRRSTSLSQLAVTLAHHKPFAREAANRLGLLMTGSTRLSTSSAQQQGGGARGVRAREGIKKSVKDDDRRSES